MIHHPMHCDGAKAGSDDRSQGQRKASPYLIHPLMVRVPYFDCYPTAVSTKYTVRLLVKLFLSSSPPYRIWPTGALGWLGILPAVTASHPILPRSNRPNILHQVPGFISIPPASHRITPARAAQDNPESCRYTFAARLGRTHPESVSLGRYTYCIVQY